MRYLLIVLLFSLFLAPGNAPAQNFPDRTVVIDPLADHDADTAGFTWLNGSRLYAEFGRYSNGSGRHHRWNAKTGGYVEIARWDSSWSIAIAGTMEMVADPYSDIAFNPRAIFWEEGVLATARLAGDASLTFGYMHRCKHDIDNLEPYLLDGKIEQITLVYSSLTARLNLRPRLLVEGPIELHGALQARNDLYAHLFDMREPIEAHATGRSMNTLANSITLTPRIDIRPRGARYGLHLNGSWMVSLFGDGEGWGGRWKGLTALGSLPFLELGADFFNPNGAAFTFFARGEWQRNGAIVPEYTPARLFLMGIRASAFETMW